ncbi:MAG: type II toxin-antitoxin system RelE/ParE family toxin [Chitinophagaceae bacterium]|nr:type II toxin-antitoxin system RelE/ParE family toxin [Chitinophagaceae bacterium]
MAIDKLEIVWTKRSQNDMRNAFDYISQDSVQNAVSVLEDIVAMANKAITNPEFFAPDKFKENNDGSYRAFENIITEFLIALIIE